MNEETQVADEEAEIAAILERLEKRRHNILRAVDVITDITDALQKKGITVVSTTVTPEGINLMTHRTRSTTE